MSAFLLRKGMKGLRTSKRGDKLRCAASRKLTPFWVAGLSRTRPACALSVRSRSPSLLAAPCLCRQYLIAKTDLKGVAFGRSAYEDAFPRAETARPVSWFKTLSSTGQSHVVSVTLARRDKSLAASRIVVVWHHSMCCGHMLT